MRTSSRAAARASPGLPRWFMARVEVSRPKRARSEVLSAARLGDRLVLLAGHGLLGHAAAGMALGLLEGDEDLLLVAAVSPDVVQVPDPVGVREFARRHLAGLEASQRSAVGGFLIETLSRNWHTAGSAQVGEALCVLREALRERLPHAVAGPESAYGLHVETISRIDDSAFYIRGWARHATSAITSLVAVSPEGSRTELIDSLFSHPRADIDRVYGSGSGDRPGFRSFFATDLPSFAPTGWIVEARTASGDAFETQAPAVPGDCAVTRPAPLADLGSAGIDAAALLENHIGPALSRLGRRPTGLAAVSKVIQVGAPPQAPADIALIIVVDHRVDLIEHQLVQFARDPEVSAADIVYVLNRPETAQAVRELAPKLYRLYREPFRLALQVTPSNF